MEKKIIICPCFEYITKENFLEILIYLQKKGFKTVSEKFNKQDSIKNHIKDNEWIVHCFKYIIIEPKGICYGNLPVYDFETDNYILKYEIMDFKEWKKNN